MGAASRAQSLCQLCHTVARGAGPQRHKLCWLQQHKATQWGTCVCAARKPGLPQSWHGTTRQGEHAGTQGQRGTCVRLAASRNSGRCSILLRFTYFVLQLGRRTLLRSRGGCCGRESTQGCRAAQHLRKASRQQELRQLRCLAAASLADQHQRGAAPHLRHQLLPRRPDRQRMPRCLQRRPQVLRRASVQGVPAQRCVRESAREGERIVYVGAGL